jgi:lysophospholipid acyltransferase (LPLAT)-like uncharacterized protein
VSSKAWLKVVIPRAAHAYMQLVGRTSSLSWEGMEHFRRVEKGPKGFIYALWHQRQVAFTYTHRNTGHYVLVSRSSDGELIARTMELSGLGAVRGSSSRGAIPAAREMVELLEAGKAVGITPDGPRGPARVVKPGVLYLAERSGCPILPISNSVSRRIELAKAWDHFHVPLPFARICVTHGPPIYVMPGDDMERKAAELKASLDSITEEADRLVAQ